MKKSHLKLLRLLFVLSDIILLNVCLFVAYNLSIRYDGHFNKAIYSHNILSASLLWLLSTLLFSLYSEYTVYKLTDIYKASLRSIVFYSGIFLLYILLASPSGFPAYFMIAFISLIVVSFAFSRFSFSAFEQLFHFNFNERKADVLAIASIGGHWIELLRLMPIFSENDVTFISNKENLKDTVNGHRFYSVPDANRKNMFKVLLCVIAVFWFVLFIRPQVIITTGAAPGLAAIFIGKLFGVKTIWIDSIANAEKLSLSGRIALKVADRVYTQWEHLSTPQIVFSGNIF